MRNLAFIFILLSCFTASAVDRITATISVTNAPLGNTNTLVVNGSTRTFTNTVTASPATLIQQTNSIPWSATNILNQITDYRFSQFHFLSQSASTNIVIAGAVGEALTVTLAGAWGKVVYSTQTVSSPTFVVRVPMAVEQTSNRTHIASLLVQGQSDNSTNSFATNAVATSNFITKGASPQQHIASPVHFAALVRGAAGVALTNGFTSALTNINSVSSNHINFGNAIRSEGSGGNSLQVGSNALAVGSLSIAIGNGAVASNTTAFAIGISAQATNNYSMSVGNGAIAGGVDSLAIGRAAQAYGANAQAIGQASIAQGSGALAILSEVVGNSSIGIGASSSVSATNSTVVGPGATSVYNDSSAFGKSATTTRTNQIRLGTSSDLISAPGIYDGPVATNGTWTGTNIVRARLDFASRANTSLANGNNAGVVFGTNVYVRLSGNTASATINGIAAEFDGSWHIAEFANPVNSLIIADNSGTDPTAANRIRTGTGADVTFTNNPVVLQFIYNASDARWKIANWFR